jgi:hypothetical protein
LVLLLSLQLGHLRRLLLLQLHLHYQLRLEAEFPLLNLSSAPASQGLPGACSL